MKGYVLNYGPQPTAEAIEKAKAFCAEIGVDLQSMVADQIFNVDARRQLHYKEYVLREDGSKELTPEGGAITRDAKAKIPAGVKIEEFGFAPFE